MVSKRKRTPQDDVPRYPLPARPGTAVSEAPTEIWIRSPQTPPRRWLRLMIALVVLLLFCGLAATAAGLLLVYESAWILPGTTVIGLPVGNQTTTAAAQAIQTAWNARQITLSAGSTTWQVSPATLGMSLDAAATAARAQAQGRTWSSLQAGLANGGHFNVAPVWEIDLETARTNLAALAPQLQVAPVNAGLRLENGRFRPTPALPGQSLDLEATLLSLSANAATAVLSSQFTLVTVNTPPAITDVTGLVDEANQLLATSLTLRGYDPITDETWTWALPADVWATWLTIQATDGTLQWNLDTAQVGAYVNQQVATLGNGRYIDADWVGTAVTDALRQGQTQVSLRIYHQPGQHIVQTGETLSSIGRAYGIPYPWIQAANPGVESLSVGQSLIIPSPDDLLPLPVVAHKRILVSITQQKVWVYENNTLKWEWIASTGISDSPTAPGIFQIQSHEETAYAGNWDLWMPYFMGIYRPVPTAEFMNGFHGFPTRNGSQLLWTGNLGQPVTYGCILVSTDNARLLYDWAEAGVVVEVQP